MLPLRELTCSWCLFTAIEQLLKQRVKHKEGRRDGEKSPTEAAESKPEAEKRVRQWKGRTS